VDDDVEAAVPVQDGADGQIGGLLRLHVQLGRRQREVFLGGEPLQGGGVAVGGPPHAGHDGVPRPCQGHGREPAEPAGGPVTTMTARAAVIR
jgi:hypothetical protein